MSTDLTNEPERLRAALVDRIRANPVREWSPDLLAAVIAVIDVEYGSPPPQPGPRRLNLVPKPSN